MSRADRAAAHARRDAALRRLRTLNGVLIGGAVAATGLLTDVTAHALPGHKRHVSTSVTPAAAPAPARASGARAPRHHRRRHAHHHRRAALRPPAQAPTPAATPTTSTTPQAVTTTPAAPTPQPAAAPAPTVSGGS